MQSEKSGLGHRGRDRVYVPPSVFYFLIKLNFSHRVRPSGWRARAARTTTTLETLPDLPPIPWKSVFLGHKENGQHNENKSCKGSQRGQTTGAKYMSMHTLKQSADILR